MEIGLHQLQYCIKYITSNYFRFEYFFPFSIFHFNGKTIYNRDNNKLHAMKDVWTMDWYINAVFLISFCSSIPFFVLSISIRLIINFLVHGKRRNHGKSHAEMTYNCELSFWKLGSAQTLNGSMVWVIRICTTSLLQPCIGAVALNGFNETKVHCLFSANRSIGV